MLNFLTLALKNWNEEPRGTLPTFLIDSLHEIELLTTDSNSSFDTCLMSIRIHIDRSSESNCFMTNTFTGKWWILAGVEPAHSDCKSKMLPITSQSHKESTDLGIEPSFPCAGWEIPKVSCARTLRFLPPVDKSMKGFCFHKISWLDPCFPGPSSFPKVAGMVGFEPYLSAVTGQPMSHSFTPP